MSDSITRCDGAVLRADDNTEWECSLPAKHDGDCAWKLVAGTPIEPRLDSANKATFVAGDKVLIPATVVSTTPAFDGVYLSVGTLERNDVRIVLTAGSLVPADEIERLRDIAQRAEAVYAGPSTYSGPVPDIKTASYILGLRDSIEGDE